MEAFVVFSLSALVVVSPCVAGYTGKATGSRSPCDMATLSFSPCGCCVRPSLQRCFALEFCVLSLLFKLWSILCETVREDSSTTKVAGDHKVAFREDDPCSTHLTHQKHRNILSGQDCLHPRPPSQRPHPGIKCKLGGRSSHFNPLGPWGGGGWRGWGA